MNDWNYADFGCYYITLVTHNRVKYFGKIENGKMIYNDIGNIVNKEIIRSFDIRKELRLKEYVIMPNHIHMIIVISETEGINPFPTIKKYDIANGEGIRTTLFVSGCRIVSHQHPEKHGQQGKCHPDRCGLQRERTVPVLPEPFPHRSEGGRNQND